MRSFFKFLAITMAAICAPGGAIAQRHPYPYGPLPPNPPPHWVAEGLPLQEWDWLRFDYSGTRGRMGLGADPFHPEGPGNFSSLGL